ncbi:hypothetical protein UY3_03268 [Chelonia mydas]|uniref:Uncharacterized protein n=1 Tax=Chelonia mydas TaxID=8469 RepID=M7C4T5_CHEMY|nr:hypothetical protein UY3_03268 [Chelonia mydas]
MCLPPFLQPPLAWNGEPRPEGSRDRQNLRTRQTLLLPHKTHGDLHPREMSCSYSLFQMQLCPVPGASLQFPAAM